MTVNAKLKVNKTDVYWKSFQIYRGYQQLHVLQDYQQYKLNPLHAIFL